jgi:uncharacterized protein (TIRG00374 family)
MSFTPASASLAIGKIGLRWHRAMLFRVAPIALVLAVVVFGALFLIRNWSQVQGIGPALRQADRHWLAVALLCQVLVEVLIAQKFRLILRRLGHDVGRLPLMRSHLYRHVLATIIPFGGIPAMYGFARDLGSEDVPTEDGLFSVLISSLASEIAFLSFLVPTLVLLTMQGLANQYALFGTMLVIAFTFGLVMMLVWAMRYSGSDSGRGQWVRRRVAPILTQLRTHQIRPRDLVGPVVMALGVNVFGIVLMDAVLRSISVETDLLTVVAARVLASVVMLLAPVFQGAGAVEFTTVGVLAAGGVPVTEALAAAVLFRIVQFWFPLSMGALGRLYGGFPRSSTGQQESAS